MTDHEKLKALMKERGLDFFDIAEITGHSYNSVKSMLQPNRELPRMAIDCRTFRLPTNLQDCTVVKIDTLTPLNYIHC